MLSHGQVLSPKEHPFTKYRTQILRYTCLKRHYFRGLPNWMFCFCENDRNTSTALQKKNALQTSHTILWRQEKEMTETHRQIKTST